MTRKITIHGLDFRLRFSQTRSSVMIQDLERHDHDRDTTPIADHDARSPGSTTTIHDHDSRPSWNTNTIDDHDRDQPRARPRSTTTIMLPRCTTTIDDHDRCLL